MPKSLDKKGKRKKEASSENSQSVQNCALAKKKKLNPDEGIAKSKQLISKLKSTREMRHRGNKSREPRLCGNGKPMPSLAELEKMFEDSDDDIEPATTTSNRNDPQRCKTPEQKPLVLPEDKILTPKTLKHIASKVMNITTNHPIMALDDDVPPSAVVPPKKRKKSDIPYIVGCKERPHVPWQPKTKFGVGDVKYGIDRDSSDMSDDEDLLCPKKRKKRYAKLNLSKSIFNDKTNEIAARLKECESGESSRSSPDSNKTVGYDYMCNSPAHSIPRSFSPLPSTSRDMNTFLRNEQRLNESLQSELCDDNTANDVEVVEVPCETIIVDDIVPDLSNAKEVKPLTHTEDDSCVIIDSDVQTNRDTNSPINIGSPTDDIYSSLDLTQHYDSDICEVIDVDDVIAENMAIIDKYRNQSDVETVTLVDPNTSYIPQQPALPEPVRQPSEPITTDVSSHGNSQASDITVVRDVTSTPEVEENPRRKAIADVVTNFFNNPQNKMRRSSEAVNIADVRKTLNNVSIWVSSLSDNVQTPRRQNIVTVNNQNSTTSHNSWSNLDVPITRSRNQTLNNIILPDNLVITNITCVPANRSAIPIKRKPKKKKSENETSLADNMSEEDMVPRGLGDCPICMDNLATTAVASTLCGHIFCMSCIKVAIKTNGKKCPTCRKSLKGVGYHQLFL